MNSLLREFKEPIKVFSPENFTRDLFFQDVETRPFLSQKIGILVQDIDQLTEEGREALCHYLDNPNEWIALYLTAGHLTAQNKVVKLVDKKGSVHRHKEEKPWEKEKRLADWIIAEAKRENVRLSLQTATTLARQVDPMMLEQELEKLICFAGYKREITLEDISLLATPMHHETLWGLGDALFAREVSRALTIGSLLLEEGMAIFPLLAHLRSQFSTSIEIIHAAEKGELPQKFPYLKGKFLEKKLERLKNYGEECLQQGVLKIFEAEVEAKNSSVDPSLLLELLMVKL